MEPVVIGLEAAADAPAVDVLLRRAFPHQQTVADLVAAIRASDGYEPGLALVARSRAEVVGFVLISHAGVVDPGGTRHDVLTLSPLAVGPALQRRGIGSSLVRAALAAARSRPELPRLVALEGDPDYYGRLGFVFAGDHGITFDLPGWAPATAAQVHLLDGRAPRVTGRLVYPPAFAVADG